MKTKPKSAAIVTIHDAPKMSKRGRNAIADWLVRQAGFLRRNSKQLSVRFTARYLYATCLILAAFSFAAIAQTNTNILDVPVTPPQGHSKPMVFYSEIPAWTTNSDAMTNAPVNLPPGFEQLVDALPPKTQAWVKQALAKVGALSVLFAVIGGIISRWLRDRMNSATTGQGQDAKLRTWFSNPLYQIAAYLLRIISINLPTVAELDRAVALQREAVIESGGLPADKT